MNDEKNTRDQRQPLLEIGQQSRGKHFLLQNYNVFEDLPSFALTKSLSGKIRDGDKEETEQNKQLPRR